MASSVLNNVFNVFCRDSSAYFATIGFVTASYIAFKAAFNVIKILKFLVFAGSTNFKKLGSWAVVTGSTDGIGKAYAKELAKRGVNIVLISRSEAKLQEVANEIEKESKVQTRIIVADFSKGLELYDSIRDQLAGLEIGTLVNNVGMHYPFPNYFLDVTDREELFMKLINVNVTAVTMMTSIVMPAMVERKKGAVINISSIGGLHPMPLITVYSACKAYVTFFSRCIQSEYESKGIICQCVVPHFVVTNMTMPFLVTTKRSEKRIPSLFRPSPTTYAKAALDSVGVSDFTNGYWAHSVQAAAVGMLPEGVIKMMSVGFMEKTRKANLENMSKKKE
ncbi:very-long-chain 3-oxoacyl-CoA reductase-like [Saccostrea echinata]|uniref:very-long-chain 3-oxoacyl-CoA reductase-like n=1 Tax=Saccostrea echinata TaxID=191078 RepID=UPI002A800208|nr:very-long-chain 3-oxoacyl-CoA reductase-like [Saccostrea echinata]